MPLFNLIGKPTYHKNGTGYFGKFVMTLIKEKNYEFFRMERRILYGKYWYFKQTLLTKFQQQYPHWATWFGLLNKADTSIGLPAFRQYERHADFAVYNMNHEGWFQMYFFVAGLIVWGWNWWILAAFYDVRGVNPEDEDLYRYKDARVTTNFDRTKYHFNHYFMSTHQMASVRRTLEARDHPDDPRMNHRVQFNVPVPYGQDRYIKYYGYSTNMRTI